MKIFLDTASVDEIRQGVEWGIVDGVTTNPTLISKEKGKSFSEVVKEILRITPGPREHRGRGGRSTRIWSGRPRR